MSSESALIRHTVQPFTESDDTRCCDNTICPPANGHVNARNMSRIVMLHTYCYRIKELCIELVIEISLYYDARSKKNIKLGKGKSRGKGKVPVKT